MTTLLTEAEIAELRKPNDVAPCTQDQLASLIATLDARDARIKELEARVHELEQGPDAEQAEIDSQLHYAIFHNDRDAQTLAASFTGHATAEEAVRAHSGHPGFVGVVPGFALTTEPQWQTMDTAPRNGTPVLLRTNICVVEAWFAPSKWEEHHEGGEYSSAMWVCADAAWEIEVEEYPNGKFGDEALRWMPLPPEPKT